MCKPWLGSFKKINLCFSFLHRSSVGIPAGVATILSFLCYWKRFLHVLEIEHSAFENQPSDNDLFVWFMSTEWLRWHLWTVFSSSPCFQIDSIEIHKIDMAFSSSRERNLAQSLDITTSFSSANRSKKRTSIFLFMFNF